MTEVERVTRAKQMAQYIVKTRIPWSQVFIETVTPTDPITAWNNASDTSAGIEPPQQAWRIQARAIKDGHEHSAVVVIACWSPGTHPMDKDGTLNEDDWLSAAHVELSPNC